MIRKFGLLFISSGVLLVATGCAGVSSSVFNPASRSAQATSQLTVIVFIIAAVVFLVVEGMLLYTTLRFKRKNKNAAELPSQTEGNIRLEIAWTIVPAVVLVIVFVFSIGTLRAVAYQPGTFSGTTTSNTVNVKVVAHQWYWEFDYPDQKIVTANDLHIPEGVPVKVSLESADVIHSFWVPELGGKTDVIPGHTNITWIQADKVGTYPGQCSEFCGVEHAKMRLEVIVETPEQFNAWLQQQQAPAVTNLTGDAADGEQIFMKGACVACHMINGTDAAGLVGPNLTHFASRQTFAGSILANNAQNVSNWLADPQAIKPGNQMPNLHLSDSDIQKLTAFLESLK